MKLEFFVLGEEALQKEKENYLVLGFQYYRVNLENILGHVGYFEVNSFMVTSFNNIFEKKKIKKVDQLICFMGLNKIFQTLI